MTRQAFGFCVLALGLTTFAFGQQPPKIGTINIQGALVSTKDGQKAAAELEGKAAPKRKEIEAKQGEINALKDQLQKGTNTLSDAAKNELYRNIDQKTKSVNREMEDSQAEMEQEQQKVLNELGAKMLAVINKYALEHGFTLVIDVSNPQTPVLWASTSSDITKDIVELYDKENGGGATSSAPSSKPPINTTMPPPASRPGTPGTTSTTQRKP